MRLCASARTLEIADNAALAQVVGAAAASGILARLGVEEVGARSRLRVDVGMLIWVSLGQSDCEEEHHVDLLISAFGAGVLCPPGSRGVERFGGLVRTVPPFVTTGDYRNFSAELAATVATGCRPCAQESNARAFGAPVSPPCPRSTFLRAVEGGHGQVPSLDSTTSPAATYARPALARVRDIVAMFAGTIHSHPPRQLAWTYTSSGLAVSDDSTALEPVPFPRQIVEKKI